jgi:hypothetical protein
VPPTRLTHNVGIQRIAILQEERKEIMSTPEQQRAAVAEVIVKAWRDDAYRSELLADPAGQLRAAGVVLPLGAHVTVLADRPGVAHIAVPHGLAASAKEQLMADIAQMLPLPDGGELRLRQSAADEFLFVLPVPPDGAAELTEDDLDLVVGGGNGGDGSFGGNGGLFGGNGGLFGGNGGNGGIWGGNGG